MSPWLQCLNRVDTFQALYNGTCLIYGFGVFRYIVRGNHDLRTLGINLKLPLSFNLASLLRIKRDFQINLRFILFQKFRVSNINR